MTLKDRAATEAWARAFARGLARPTVILLSGGLGAGKTQLTRWCLLELGCTEVSSPTFAIHHHYAGVDVDHVDLYRVESDAALEAVGFWDLFLNPRGLVFVEWADRLPNDVWPVDWTRVFVKIGVAGEARELTLTYATPGSTPA